MGGLNLLLICRECINFRRRTQWPRGIRRGSAAARLLVLWGHGYLSVVSVVLAVRGLYVGLIPRPGESYRVWCAGV
jgi:hypothetical protein